MAAQSNTVRTRPYLGRMKPAKRAELAPGSLRRHRRGPTLSDVNLLGTDIIETRVRDPKYILPKKIGAFLKAVLSISRGDNIIPFRLSESVGTKMTEWDDTRSISETADPDLLQELPTDEQALAIYWQEVLKIHNAARECLRDRCSEASWNGEVHHRILRLGLEGHWESQGVWNRNVTTHRISNETGI